MAERYPHKHPINDAIKRIENLLYDELLAIYKLGFEDGKNDVLDNIRTKIEGYKSTIDNAISEDELKIEGMKESYIDCLEVIDKYKMELKIPDKWKVRDKYGKNNI